MAVGRNPGTHVLLKGLCLLAEMIYLHCLVESVELLWSRFVAESWDTVTNGEWRSGGQGF